MSDGYIFGAPCRVHGSLFLRISALETATITRPSVWFQSAILKVRHPQNPPSQKNDQRRTDVTIPNTNPTPNPNPNPHAQCFCNSGLSWPLWWPAIIVGFRHVCWKFIQHHQEMIPNAVPTWFCARFFFWTRCRIAAFRHRRARARPGHELCTTLGHELRCRWIINGDTSNLVDI